MLTYKVRLGKDDFKMEDIVWSEKYLSPDLLFISGVTDTEYHLEKYKSIPASSSIANMDSELTLECHNVLRQGYVLVKGKEYDVIDVNGVGYYGTSTNAINAKALFVNGKYFYFNKLKDRDDDTSGYTITNLLTVKDGEISDMVVKKANFNEKVIKIDTLYWIEDGCVNIDGHQYIYDRDETENGTIRYLENGKALDGTDITRCSAIECHPYDVQDMYEVTKFKLSKNEVMEMQYDNVSFCRYYYFVSYKGYECPVVQKVSGDAYSFVCEVPKGLLEGSGVTDNRGVKEFPLYYITEYGEYGPEINYAFAVSSGCLLNSSKYSEHLVGNLNDLKNIYAFINIKDEEKAYFKVSHDVINGNDGNEILLSMSSEHCPLRVGDKVNFKMENSDSHECFVFNSSNFNGENEEYIVHNGTKHPIEANICDKVEINREEYIVTYNNGKVVGKDCLVLINGEEVPMKITSTNSGDYDSGTVKRYGRIIVNGDGDVERATNVTYSLKAYSGVTINDVRYLQRDYGEGEKYVEITKPIEYEFVITEKIGNSSYVCVPHINENDFTDDFVRYYSKEMCSQVVNNKSEYSLETKNKIFGDREITSLLVFDRVAYPSSSDEYYDLFSDLRIYARNAYLSFPISLTKDVAINALQEELVKRDFFDKEKDKAMNGIVDMEKDVYAPKYITNNNGKYSGSQTIFKPITEINFNFHFRTRDMSSWKINDGNYRIDSKGDADNWFVTDYHPYSDLLAKKEGRDSRTRKYGKKLMEASDLMGYLYFTNDDIFYQRDKVGKSFVRLSYYDSTDPQTQSLLATSCVFVDEHKLFKKFIDNSRKNEMLFGSTSSPEYGDNKERIYTLNKISVDSEYLANLSGGTIPKYDNYQNDCVNAHIENEKHRLSSRLSVNNKYETETSSEGFYLYIFREYAENLHPKPIYMKIEYNHAGIGKMIPFLIPMKWGSGEGSALTNKMYPKEAYTFEKMDDDELAEFKKGIPLSYVYAQTYIPLYAVYDFVNKEYAYVFDSRYVQVNDDSTINLNLFELKVKDESKATVTEQDQKDVTQGRQKRAVINVNTEQFDKKDFNNKIE